MGASNCAPIAPRDSSISSHICRPSEIIFGKKLEIFFFEKKLNWLSERLTSLGIMGEEIRGLLEPLGTILPQCSRSFSKGRGALFGFP